MTIKEKLKKAQKKAKTTIVTGALAMAAVAAPIKGQSAEATIDTAPAQTTEVTPAQKQRQQMFEAAVRANMPKEEIAKYVDFPEFIPVDKNGQLDEKQAEDLLTGVVTNHIDAVKKFYKEVSGTYSPDGYAAGGNMGMTIPEHRDKEKFDNALVTFLSEVTGDKKNSSEFLKKAVEAADNGWTQVAQRANSQLVHIWHWQDYVSVLLCSLSSLLAGASVFGVVIGADEKDKKMTRISALLTAIGIVGAVSSIKIHNPDSVQGSSDPTAIVNFLKEGVQNAHDSYLTGVIQTEKDRQEVVAKGQFIHQAKKLKTAQK